MKKMQWFALLSAIFLTYWGAERGFVTIRNLGAINFFNPFLYLIFFIDFLPLALPSVPLWYYALKRIKK